MVFTLYVDESGQFPTRSNATLGPRVLGGVLLPGDSAAHDPLLRPPLTDAFREWPGAWHFCDINAGASMARALHELPDDAPLPPSWRAHRDGARRFSTSQQAFRRVPLADPSLHDALEALSTAVRDDLRAVVAGLPEAHTLLVAEHDMTFAEGRSRSMTEALVFDALAWLARGLRAQTPARLDVIYHRQAPDAVGYSLDATSLASRVCAGLGLPAAALECTFQRHDGDARQVPGLVLADVVCNSLGPGGRQSTPMQPREIAAWSLFKRRQKAADLFGARVRHREVDAVAMHGQLTAIVGGSLDARGALSASARWVSHPPQGSLPASIECAHELLRGWDR